MLSRLSFLIAGLLLAIASPALSQSTASHPAIVPIRFESWRPAAPVDLSGKSAVHFVASARNRSRQALLGGAIGAVAGVVFCTAVSTLTNDSAEGGVSFCPLDSYLLIGGAGFALGFAIGWVI
jgi:uncharacterized BrkB/YihY/UPF0761 family membrane protein